MHHVSMTESVEFYISLNTFKYIVILQMNLSRQSVALVVTKNAQRILN